MWWSPTSACRQPAPTRASEPPPTSATSHPDIGVVVLSQYANPSYALALLADGSAGRAYLLKERVGDVDDLCAAIREVAAGRSVIDPTVVEALVNASVRKPASDLDRLTPRETEILGGDGAGQDPTPPSRPALVLSERAVEKHTNSIFSKLGLSEETRPQPAGQGGAALPRPSPRVGSHTEPKVWYHPVRLAGRHGTVIVK